MGKWVVQKKHDMEKPVRIVTHNGRFHLDELLATSVLSLLLESEGKQWEVIRSRDPEVWKTADYLVDVGGEINPSSGRFDHHQEGGAGKHENGIPFSSFGAVWKTYGEQLSGSREIAEEITKRLVYPVDMADNGIEVYAPIQEGIHPYLFHNFVSVMVPTWKEGPIHDAQFRKTLEITRTLLAREIVWNRDRLEVEGLVCAAYEYALDKRLVVLDQPYPSAEVLARFPEPLFVVKPRSQGDFWEVEAVRDDPHAFLNRKDLPASWAGKRDQELAAVTGVSDAVFCHLKRFVAVAKSKEGALALASLALQ